MVMLKEERYQYILHQLREAGRVLSLDLSAALGISEDTVRRDLIALEREGKLRRAHGGALPLVPASEPYQQREQHSPEDKRALARAVLPLLAEQRTIILDASTTNVQVALALPPDCAATVITTSPPIALALMSHPKVEVMLIGGLVNKANIATFGAGVVEALANIHADVCVLGVCGIDVQHGVTAHELDDAQVKRAMIRQAAKTLALVTAAKLDTTSAYRVAALDQIAHLVIGGDADAAQVARYRAQGLDVIHATHSTF